MPTAIIADDEPMMRAALRDHLSTLWPELDVRSEVEDGPSALHCIETLRPDVAFLDIRMPGLSGMEVARALTVPTRVVFVTAHDQHAVEAFEASALDYVLKPLEAARMARVVAKVRKSLEADAPPSVEQLLRALSRTGASGAASPVALQSALAADVTANVAALSSPPSLQAQAATGSAVGKLEWIQVAVGQQVRMLHVEDVMYFESDTKYTRVVAEDCDGLIRLTLKELTESLDSAYAGRFLQTHRSTVVNRRFVRSVHRKGEVVELELKGRPERLKVSLSNHHLFKAM